jgi:hypothetical protein
MEIWKPVKDYEGLYEVSSLGRVKSLPKKVGINKEYLLKEKIMKPTVMNSGYLKTNLSKNNIKKSITIHKLVAVTFLNHKQCGHKLVIDHINRDKLDNRVENLRVVTSRENSIKIKTNCTSKYTGVSFVKSSKKWASIIFIDGKNISLGRFNTEEEAHQVYQNKLKTL